MPAARNIIPKLHTRFEDLVSEMPPKAIAGEDEHDAYVERVDRLMAAGRLTKGQEIYLETLVQLISVYEAGNHAIDTRGLTGLNLLKHLVREHDFTAIDVARILAVHPSMGSKILKGERSLTVDHAKALGDRFKLRFEAFLID